MQQPNISYVEKYSPALQEQKHAAKAQPPRWNDEQMTNRGRHARGRPARDSGARGALLHKRRAPLRFAPQHTETRSLVESVGAKAQDPCVCMYVKYHILLLLDPSNFSA